MAHSTQLISGLFWKSILLPLTIESIAMSDLESLSQTNKESTSGISRREILMGIGAVATAAYAGAAVSAMPGHDHSKHSSQLPDLLDAANDCHDKGQRCIAHCLVSFQEGDVQLADCASKVHEMLAICGAFSYLLAANSGYLKAYASVCEKVCKDCEKECRKHEEHIECKACADACAEIVDQIKLRLS
jgi:Cys-rich four helix bundle protein (predicted Tat secretion target)